MNEKGRNCCPLTMAEDRKSCLFEAVKPEPEEEIGSGDEDEPHLQRGGISPVGEIADRKPIPRYSLNKTGITGYHRSSQESYAFLFTGTQIALW